MFFSTAFVGAAAAAQWSILFTAGLLIPAAAVFYAAKPNIGAVLALSWNVRTAVYAVAGGLVLLLLSFALFPGWLPVWLETLRSAKHMGSPILRPGGLLVLLALARWRRPEARLIVALACMRQTNSWYEVLPLFLVPATLTEMVYFTLAVSTGALFEQYVIQPADEIEYNRQIGTLMIALAYIPATLMVLRRPNEGRFAVWPRAASFSRYFTIPR
jgi:hypothetical protein